MRYKNLGRTGLKISAVALGCGNFGGIGSTPSLLGKGSMPCAKRPIAAAWA